MSRDTEADVDHEQSGRTPEDGPPEGESGPEGHSGSGERAGEGPGDASPGSGQDVRDPEGSDRALEDDASTTPPTGDALERELAELNDRHLRLAAEFNNYRRRQEAERLETWGRAQAELVGRFLDVLDDLQRVEALELEDEAVTAESIIEGIDLVERKFVRTLEETGAEIVDPVDGDRFDPETMETMMRVPAEDDAQDDHVARTFQKGYLFKGNLVRPARVSVYKS